MSTCCFDNHFISVFVFALQRFDTATTLKQNTVKWPLTHVTHPDLLTIWPMIHDRLTRCQLWTQRIPVRVCYTVLYTSYCIVFTRYTVRWKLATHQSHSELRQSRKHNRTCTWKMKNLRSTFHRSDTALRSTSMLQYKFCSPTLSEK